VKPGPIRHPLCEIICSFSLSTGRVNRRGNTAVTFEAMSQRCQPTVRPRSLTSDHCLPSDYPCCSPLTGSLVSTRITSEELPLCWNSIGFSIHNNGMIFPKDRYAGVAPLLLIESIGPTPLPCACIATQKPTLVRGRMPTGPLRIRCIPPIVRGDIRSNSLLFHLRMRLDGTTIPSDTATNASARGSSRSSPCVPSSSPIK
jgi:hypothetical protein